MFGLMYYVYFLKLSVLGNDIVKVFLCMIEIINKLVNICVIYF